MKTVAIINQKGGTGKTTTTINLGSALAKEWKKVLVIDLDPQGNLGYSLGVLESEHSMADVLLGEKSLDEVLVDAEGMKLAPSNNQLVDAELTLAVSENREHVLKEILKGQKGYDFILIDCPPSLSVLTLNALLAADEVIIPMQMEVLSLQGLDQIVNTIDKVKSAFSKKLKIAGILPVMVDGRRKLSHEVHDYISENYSIRIFESYIRANVKASEAPSFGKSVVAYKPKSSSAVDYRKFAEEFLKMND
jgi:chromosome partitioning protein